MIRTRWANHHLEKSMCATGEIPGRVAPTIEQVSQLGISRWLADGE